MRPINRLVGSVRVRRITAETIRDYQRARLAEGVSGRTINMEVMLVRLVLKKAKHRGRIAEDVKNLPNHLTLSGVCSRREKKGSCL